jgi:hypothetical protein
MKERLRIGLQVSDAAGIVHTITSLNIPQQMVTGFKRIGTTEASFEMPMSTFRRLSERGAEASLLLVGGCFMMRNGSRWEITRIENTTIWFKEHKGQITRQMDLNAFVEMAENKHFIKC